VSENDRQPPRDEPPEREVIRPEDFEDDYALPRSTRVWRKVLATSRIVRRGSPDFTYHASANAVGTLVAIAIAYLVSLAAGLVAAVPFAVIASLLAVGAAVVATVFRLAPKRLLMARASEVLDVEPGPVVESMKRMFAPENVDEWDVLDAVWELPEPERTIIAVRFGGHMTLAAIGDALGVSRELVRQREGRAIGTIAKAVGAEWPRKSRASA
jgi:hypothetical protein